MIYEIFESILVPEDNEKQNPEDSCRKQWFRHVVYSNS